jgi:hypothetical protein
VFASIVWRGSNKNKVLSSILSIVLVVLLFVFGNKPWQGASESGSVYDSPMMIAAENIYKIPQEHIDICDAIINDMDGARCILSLYEIHGTNDVGGTLNYSIRMYTSKIQLRCVMSYEDYSLMTSEERDAYWGDYIHMIQDGSTDSSSYYFLFPVGDERIDDLLDYGCVDFSIDSSAYRLLEFTPST